MSFWVFLHYKFEKKIAIFGISTLEFVEMQKFVRNKEKN